MKAMRRSNSTMPLGKTTGSRKKTSSLGIAAKIWLRVGTHLRDSLPVSLGMSPPHKIIFIHVPKCAGFTIQNYLRRCIGGKKSGKTGKLGEILLKQAPTEAQIQLACKARFVCGHFSWSSVERMDVPADAFMFTFLRAPASRLDSWFRFSSNYPDEHFNESVRTLAERSRRMSREEMFTSSDPIIQNMTDNYMVRQFSGHLIDYPIRDEDWPMLLDEAKSNLRKLSFVGMQETFAQDFHTLCQRLNLPQVSSVPMDNVTATTTVQTQNKQRPSNEKNSVLNDAVASLTCWDKLFYEYAQELRSQVNGQT